MKIKSAKWFLRFGGFVGRYLTKNEKTKNSDPEISNFVRAKRKPNNIPDSYTDTKWIKKISDKSWKNRSKNPKQYMKHVQSNKEKTYCTMDRNFAIEKVIESSTIGWNNFFDVRLKLNYGTKFLRRILEDMSSDGIVELEYRYFDHRPEGLNIFGKSIERYKLNFKNINGEQNV